MKNLKALGILLVLAVMLVFMVGCDTEGDTKTIVQTKKVGDVLVGGFVVSYVDANSDGYIADRSFDEDGDEVVDEEQTVIAGQFLSDITLDADRVYYMRGAVRIGDNEGKDVTLTIPAGTLIKGETSQTDPGLLIITRGAKIMAEGTATNPIVFTSSNREGYRSAKDWGGIVINGYARVQKGTAEGEGNTGAYGGDNDADNSGVLKYVRVEFAGTLFSADNELNGIAFQGVGSGTTVDYVQVHMNGDDGVEFFGGSVAVKHLVLTGNQDDSLDFDDGWNGSAQFVLIQQYAGGDHGIEADGDAEDVFPPAHPVIANFTYVGNEGTDHAFRFKSATNPSVYNCVVANVNPEQMGKAGEEYDVNAVNMDGALATVTFEGCWFGATIGDDPGATFTGCYEPTSNVGLTGSGLDAGVVADDNASLSAFTTLTAASGITVGTIPATDPAENALTATDYAGAVDPASPTAWWDGWTAFPKN